MNEENGGEWKNVATTTEAFVQFLLQKGALKNAIGMPICLDEFWKEYSNIIAGITA